MNNIERAVDFLNKVVDSQYEYAYQEYVNPSGKHHNFFTSAGFDSLKLGMQAADKEMSDRSIEVKNAFGDGDMVAVHSHFVPKSDDLGIAVVHIFRFENGKIVEMWDVARQVPEDQVNSDGAF